jgi:hemolysin III
MRKTTERDQSQREEIANSISHAIGLLAALAATPALMSQALRYGRPDFVVGAAVFAVSMVLLYLASALYHGLPRGKAKSVFWTIEHSAIYVLIAGTYTPFTLGALRGPWGWTLLVLIWSFAVVGVVLKFLKKLQGPVPSTALYLLMGWLLAVAIKPLIAHVPLAGLLWIGAGGAAYTLGTVFFLTDSRVKYGHFIWHLFVMAGTACHYCAVIWYAV